MDRIERIQAMEALMNEADAAVKAMERALSAYDAAQTKFLRLAKYYGSAQWHKDRNADEKGLLPEGLARGVLSEDLVWDVLTGNTDNALRMLEMGTDIMRRL
ncbi:MAG: DUF4298 domain-containing protein [Clostridia bacterium]|nr:DUF4298 domain-containing protein [Clostridia bacterium]MBQ6372933.1 DUF4298 domain-containing protein [Clostridia bacterium]